MNETIFDVLIALFEDYMDDENAPFPDDDEIREELLHAGFAQREINQVFSWLESLGMETDMSTTAATFRIFSPLEQRKLDIDCRNFLLVMESSGILSAAQRELVIDRAMAFDAPEISADALKWIVLMILLSQNELEEAEDFSAIETRIYPSHSMYLH